MSSDLFRVAVKEVKETQATFDICIVHPDITFPGKAAAVTQFALRLLYDLTREGWLGQKRTFRASPKRPSQTLSGATTS